MKIIEEKTIEGLPEGCVVRYFGKIGDSLFFVVHTLDEKTDCPNFRVSIGTVDDLHEVEVTQPSKMCDDGIEIETTEVNFYFPPSNAGDPPYSSKGMIELFDV